MLNTLTIIGITFISSWGTYFVIDDAKTHQIHHQLYQCLAGVEQGCQKCYGDPEPTPEELKAQVQVCDEEQYEAIKLDSSPPTFYTTTGPDPYEEFWMCSHFLASYHWDILEGSTAEDFRESFRDCLHQYDIIGKPSK